jgi:ABC-type Na+ efflux pump permease subunit
MVGSVLHQEMLLGSRRTRLYILRWVYAILLLLQVLGIVLWILLEVAVNTRARTNADPSQVFNQIPFASIVGGTFAEFYVYQQMILLLLATPAFVAGAITDEKRRGTLQYLLTADLDTRHIVLGKLFGRIAQVGLLMISGLPLFCLMAGFGGIEPATLVLTAVIFIAPLFALSSATLLASVLCKQTRDAVLVLYVFGALGWIAVAFIGGPLDYLNPLFTLSVAWGPFHDINWSDLLFRLGIEVLSWGMIGGVCLAISVWQLRPVYIRELESSPGKKSRFFAFQREPIGDDPVRWRERHVESLTPTVFKVFLIFLIPLWIVPYLLIYFFTPATGGTTRRLSQWPGVVLVAALTTLTSSFLLWLCLPPGTTFAGFTQALLHFDVRRLQAMLPDGAKTAEWFWLQGLGVMLLFSLVVGIRCSGAVTGEREKQTWEAVLLTPISARQLVHSKLWGVLSGMVWFLLAYAAPALLLSVVGGLGALAWTAVWLATTVVGIYFIGAAGIWASVRSKSSWRALLSTLGMGYLGGLVLYLLTTPAILILALLFILVLFIIDSALNTGWGLVAAGSWPAWWPVWKVASCICLAGAFFLAARFFLGWAQRWIADRDRTRHWHEEPIYRRARRPLGPPMYRPRY